MTSETRIILATDLIRDEGLRVKPYVDTVGKLTIGVGRNLTDRGITPAEARYLLDHDIAIAEQDCYDAFPWFADLDEDTQRAVVNLSFNLGITKLRTFTETLQLIADGRRSSAASHLLTLPWAAQVGAGRAGRVAALLRGPGIIRQG